ncbi:diguanylate cyclase [Candidatus Omnitrophota bacterium]
MQINPYAISALITSLISLFLGSLVFYYRTKKIHVLLATFNFMVTLWSLFIGIAVSVNDAQQAYHLWKIAHLFGIFLAPVFFHLAYEFCHVKSNKFYFVLLAYGHAILFNFLQYFNGGNILYYPEAKFMFDSLYNIQVRTLNFYTIMIFWIFIIFFGVYKLIIFSFKNKNKRGKQGLLLGISTTIGVLGGGSTWIPLSGINYYPITILTVAFYSLSMTYTIFRYDFFEISIVFEKSIVYTVLITFISIVYLTLVILFEKLFQVFFGYSSPSISILLAFSLGILFIPLKSKVEKMIHQTFLTATPFEIAEQKEQLSKDIALRKNIVLDTINYLSSILDLDLLLSKVLEESMKSIQAERGVLLFYTGAEENKHLEVILSRNIKYNETEDYKAILNDAVLDHIHTQKSPLLFVPHDEKHNLEFGCDLQKHGISSALCAPVRLGEEILGVVVLDSKSTELIFNNEDVWVVDLILNHAGIAIQNAKLYKRAIFDGLTELYNRTFFETYVNKTIHEAHRYKNALSLLIIDIDFFKDFNDTYGHQTGDIVLKKISNILKNSVRKSDVAARYGGDEFVMLLTETNIEGAGVFAERLRKSVENADIIVQVDNKKEILKATLSIGITELTDQINVGQLMELVDKALYRAKQQGRNQISI